MKIVHLSDTHLGFRGLGKQTAIGFPGPTGPILPRVQAEIMRGFERAIDRIVESVHPDIVVHAGNLFDNAAPSAFTLDFAIRQVTRLHHAGIPLVLIEGNQSSPREVRHGHVLKLLSHFPGITVLCDECEPVRVGPACIHPAPHRMLMRGFVPDTSAVDASCINLLLAHCVADGHHLYQTGRSAASLAVKQLAPHYNYVALGHNRYFAQALGTERAFYSGSTAMVTWADFNPTYKFGFNVVTLDDAACPADSPHVRREELDTVLMHAYGIQPAAGFSAKEIMAFLQSQADDVLPDDAYCYVDVKGIDPLVRGELSYRAVEEIFQAAAYCKITLLPREQRWDPSTMSMVEASDLLARFKELVSQTDGDAEFLGAVQTLGEDLLLQAEHIVNAADAETSEREESD